MATPSKSQLLNDVYTLLKKRYKLEARPARPPVLEAIVYGICHEGTTREQASQALNRFKDGFFDWNEVRVSSVDEIRAALVDLPDSEGKAQRIRRFLRQLFERTYGFTLEAIAKKPQKDAVRDLQQFEAGESDYVAASVVQQALGGHAIPLDAPIRRALERLGAAEPGADAATLRSALERAVPKNRGVEFTDLMEELAHDTCVEGVPDCPRCELRKICPTGRARLESDKKIAKVAAKAAAKPAPPAPAPAPAKPARPGPPAAAPTKAAKPAAPKPTPPKPTPLKSTPPAPAANAPPKGRPSRPK